MKRNSSVTNLERDIRYRVERVHRDGTVTVRALFALTKTGKDRNGYLGYKYRVNPECLQTLRSPK